MKYNLFFENIPEVIPNTDMKEDTQQILKEFLQSELEIENVQLHNVHRLKPRRDRKPHLLWQKGQGFCAQSSSSKIST